MAVSLISNPPYNLKWKSPPFAYVQPRFQNFDVPPDSNANFAFILTALSLIDSKAAFLLPNGIMTTSQTQEANIRRQLIENNLIEAVIRLPDRMFESTSIPICALVLNKQKKTLKVAMVDMTQECVQEQRDQNGQYGGSSHTARTYHKMVNVLTGEGMDKAVKAIQDGTDIPGFCRAVTIEEIRKQDYLLTPSRYIEMPMQEHTHRSYADIAADYNRLVQMKNTLKLTVNESLAKSLGLYDVFTMMQNAPDLSDSFRIVGQTAEKQNFIQLSKNAAEFKIENKSREQLPPALLLFIRDWKQYIMALNTEENRILAEFRDALLPDLMSGKVSVNGDV